MANGRDMRRGWRIEEAPLRSCRLAIVLLVAAGCGAPRTPPPPDASTPAVSARRSHRVAPGETLCSLGGRYGVSPASLGKANGIVGAPVAPLPEGRNLTLKGTEPARYEVRAGDTLSAISRWSSVPVDELARYNRLADPDHVVTGRRLQLPGGAGTACPPAARPRVAAPRDSRAATTATASIAPGEEPARPGAPTAGAADLERARASLGLAEERYAEADYDAATAAAGSVRVLLADSDTPPARQLAARAAAVEALCHAGRRRNDEAVAAFRTALELDPGFELDSGYASPRVTPLLEEARTRPTP